MANVYKNAKLDLTTTNVTTLYTCPAAKTAVFKSILVSEDKVKAVGANTTIELLTQPLVVNEAEILKFNAATANRLHVVASYLEIS